MNLDRLRLWLTPHPQPHYVVTYVSGSPCSMAVLKSYIEIAVYHTSRTFTSSTTLSSSVSIRTDVSYINLSQFSRTTSI